MGRQYKYKRMYAVMCKGVGIIGGTMGYSRREAISHFYGGCIIPAEWNAHKREGYRTVEACVRTIRVSARP